VRPPLGAALPRARSPRGLTAIAAAAASAALALGVARGWVGPGQLDREGVEELGATPGSALHWGAWVLAWASSSPAVAAAGLLLLLARVRRLGAARLVALLAAARLAGRWLLPLAVGASLAMGLGQLTDRPVGSALVQAGVYQGASFPSAEALGVALLVGLVWSLWPRPWVRLAAVAWGLAVCLAIVALGLQWPSDVLGGALLGTALVAGGPLGRGSRAGRP
jgi:membrane-associated phospholipid phosphatase